MLPVAPFELSTGSEDAVTTKLVLTWQPRDNALYYLMAAEGFRRDHPNSGAGLPSVIDPNDPTIIPVVASSDSLWNYEFGMKKDWLDGRLQTNIAAYFIVWDDIQISATRTSESLPFTSNAGDAETMGIEAEILAWPTEALQLGFNITIADSEIVALADLDAITSGDVKGGSLAAPDFQASGFAQYYWDLNNGQDIYARMDIQYIGDYSNGQPNVPGSPTQALNPNFEKIQAYSNVNAQLGWESDRMTVALYGENILNNDDYRTINPANSTKHRYRTLRPRTFGVRLDWKL